MGRYGAQRPICSAPGAAITAVAGGSILMSAKMMTFVSVPPAMPDKRPVAERRRDFAEIYGRFSPERAEEQASRCEQCGVPFCQVHCPLHNNIPDWLRLAVEGRLEEAYELSSATNNMPEICGRICPQDRLCEGNCVIEQSGHGGVTIGSVEKYITDTAFDRGWVQPVRPLRERAASVAIIGAGPAGLACAEELRRQGWQVHVYDRYDRIGGLLIYGIPGFKLEKEVVERRARHLRDSGIHFHLASDIGGAGPSFTELRRRHEAVFIGTGVYRARDLTLPGCGLPGIVPALEFLTASNRKGLGDAVPAFDEGGLNAAGKHVVVIGGGDTAMDCVRTAVRQGARSVKCLYRRDRANMPGSQREVANAEEEGVEFVWLSAPEAFLGDARVEAVRAHRMRLGAPDGQERDHGARGEQPRELRRGELGEPHAAPPVGPGSRARSAFLSTLPRSFFGRSSRNSMKRGYLCFVRWARTWAFSSSATTSRGRVSLPRRTT